MYSIKPGRGPSLGTALGSLAAAVFGVIWMVGALSMGAPLIFMLFGVVFVIFAIGQGIYHFYNATSRNRFSTFDITADHEESDPLADAMGHTRRRSSRSTRTTQSRVDELLDNQTSPRQHPGNFCPYCGAKAKDDFDFCPACGKDI